MTRGGAQPPGSVRVLLGGLGLGITLAALLEESAVGHVRVVELFPDLIDWNRRHLGFLHGGALDDRRVTVRAGDLVAYLEGPAEPFDLILLDIDNGPTALSLPSNERLYASPGLALLRGWMSPGGVAVVWATEDAPDFERRLDTQPDLRWSKTRVAWRAPRGDRVLVDVLYILASVNRSASPAPAPASGPPPSPRTPREA